MTELYLSRLLLTVRRRDVQRDLADCHAMHRRLLLGFPDDAAIERARERYGVLYRIETNQKSNQKSSRQDDGALLALVQSQYAPDWSRLPAGYLAQPAAVKRLDALYEQLVDGMELRFRLRANPTKRFDRRNTTQGEQWRGKRVELRREDEQLAWLRRKGDAAGFALMAVSARSEVAQAEVAQAEVAQAEVAAAQVAERTVVHGRGDNGRQLTFGLALFEGRLRITDVERFRLALAAGIGSGKAYGFGLLSIAPIA